MELKSIINFDDALSALRNESCDDICPFVISTNGIQKYNSMKHKLNTYLQEPNQSEIQQLFQKCDVWQMFQEGEISESEALEVLLRLHNFHLLEKFHFQTNSTIVKILQNFSDTFRENLMITNYSLKSLSLKYFKFTTSLSLQPPALNKVISSSDANVENTTVTNISISSLGSTTNETAGASITNSERRNNEFTKQIGLFHPKVDNWHQIYEIKNANNFKVSKSRLSNIGDIYTDFIFELTSSDESLIQQAVCFNYFRSVTKLISSLFDKAYVLPEIREVISINSSDFTVKPDFELKFLNTKIPCEVKKANLNDKIQKYYESKSITKASLGLIQIFSQLVREAIAVGTPFIILTDYSTFVAFDLMDFHLNPDFEGDNFCFLTRELQCRMFSFEDTPEGSTENSYSFYTKLFMFLIECQSSQSSHKEIMERFMKNSVIHKSLRDVLIEKFYHHINNIQLETLAYDRENKYNFNNSVLSNEIDVSTDISKYSITLKANYEFSKFYIDAVIQMSRYKSWQSYNMSDFARKYKFISIISGSEFSSRNSTTFVVSTKAKKNPKKFFLKVLDPIRNATYVEKNSVFQASYNSTFKDFFQEIVSYKRLGKMKSGIAKLESFGFLKNNNIHEYHEILKLSKTPPEVAGFYILLEYIPGLPLNKYSGNKIEVGKKAQETLLKIHQLGCVHLDIHSQNILIYKDIPYFVDFGRSKTSQKRQFWDRTKSKIQKNDLKEKQKDDHDLQEVLEKFNYLDPTKEIQKSNYSFPENNLNKSKLNDKMLDAPKQKKSKSKSKPGRVQKSKSNERLGSIKLGSIKLGSKKKSL
ncbi:uncharacterized protein RJT21DRAFT_113071 [Scheffersomyces amazonensis]|uniref:uncharacterized protein n=1 Tax=Scheffersomyces amazonensis TaxID=1078765 RepID=UPI00315CB8B3